MSNSGRRIQCGATSDVASHGVLRPFFIIRKLLYAGTVFVFALYLAGCNQGPDSPRGFSLPEGSAEAGKQAFVDLQCTSCHRVAKIDLPPPKNALEMLIVLGGQRASHMTYGELVTSIINPSHKFIRGHSKDAIQQEGVSKMPVYNEVMTVNQLINLVSFLEQQYEVLPYQNTYYPYF